MRHQFECHACKGRYFETCGDGSPYAHVCGPLPADKKNPQRERPDKRDENPLMDGRGNWLGIRSEGLGVTCLTDGRLQEPRWISAMHERRVKREEKEDA